MDKRGLQHFSKLGGQHRPTILQRDVVLFPYTFDYLQEIPSGTGTSYLEFVTLGGGQQALERHVRRAVPPGEATGVKVTVVGLAEVRADHINQ